MNSNELTHAQENTLNIKDRILYSIRKSFSGVRYQFNNKLEGSYEPKVFSKLTTPYVFVALLVRTGEQELDKFCMSLLAKISADTRCLTASVRNNGSVVIEGIHELHNVKFVVTIMYNTEDEKDKVTMAILECFYIGAN
jgi:hypothetical protein